MVILWVDKLKCLCFWEYRGEKTDASCTPRIEQETCNTRHHVTEEAPPALAARIAFWLASFPFRRTSIPDWGDGGTELCIPIAYWRALNCGYRSGLERTNRRVFLKLWLRWLEYPLVPMVGVPTLFCRSTVQMIVLKYSNLNTPMTGN
jgi:hypothetical protein